MAQRVAEGVGAEYMYVQVRKSVLVFFLDQSLMYCLNIHASQLLQGIPDFGHESMVPEAAF